MIAIGVMGVMSTVVVALISPRTLLTKVQDAKRTSAASSLERGFTQYQIDKSALPPQIPEHPQNAVKICREGVVGDPGCVNMDSILPYLPGIPVDPAEPCANYSGYTVYTETSRVHVIDSYMGQTGSPSTTCGPSPTPVLSSLASSNLTGTAATITWTTDVAANSRVEYGLTTSYGSTSATDVSYVTSHSLRLTGMTTATLYHYRAKSNAGGSDGLSSDGTFTTATVAFPVISSVASSGITSTTATITWTTDQQADSQVQYGLTTSYTDLTNVDPAWVTSHSVTLTGLLPSTTYHYRARSANSSSLLTNGSDVTFTTAAGADVTPPVISSVTSSSITDIAALITWTTDEASDTQIEYGTSIVYGSTTTLADTSPMVTSHSQGLSGLTASTLYHYRVKSRDASGNLATSGDFTFTTGAPGDVTPPVLSSVTSSSITTTAATITWTSDELSDTQVEYGLTTSYGSTTTLADTSPMVTSHSQGLSGLSTSTLYHYRVNSRDASGNLGTSGDFTFTTATPDVTPPVLSGIAVTATGATAMTIGWTTDELSDTQINYGLTAAYGSTTTLADTSPMVTTHSQGLSGLSSLTLYHYRVKSKDAAANLATSGDFVFTSAGSYITLDSTGSVGQYSSIAVGADGFPIISYYDGTGLNLKVLKCGNASCTSGNVTTTLDTSGSVGQYTSIAVPADGLPVIAYYYVTGLDMRILKCGNAACSSGNTITTVDTTGSVGTFTSIAIAADGLPMATYYDLTNLDLKYLKCGNTTCNAGNTIVSLDGANSVGQYSSIAKGADGFPVISYYDSGNLDLKFIKCGDALCTSNTPVTLESTGSIGTFTSLVVPADGLPVMSYQNVTGLDLKVLKCGNAACSAGNTATSVDTVGSVGQYTAIALAADGLPMVSYYDTTNLNLKYVKCGNAACSAGNTIKTLDIKDTTGQFTSIAQGGDTFPIMSYSDGTQADLKFLKCTDSLCTQP